MSFKKCTAKVIGLFGYDEHLVTVNPQFGPLSRNPAERRGEAT